MNLSELNLIVEKIKKNNKLVSDIASKLVKKNDSFSVEEKLFKKIPVKKLNSCVSGVDSGFLLNSFHGIDFILVKGCAVNFKFHDNKLVSADYLPKKNVLPELFFSSFYERDEVILMKSLLRLKKEISLAIQCIESFSPEFVFLDGSIIPQYVIKPKKKALNNLFEEVIALYNKLFECSLASNSTVIACVEDSRGKRFIDFLFEDIKFNEVSVLRDFCVDSRLLDLVLASGYRTKAIPYSNHPSEHEILKEFSKFKEMIFVSYIRPSFFDRPLRIEFLSEKKQCESSCDLVAAAALSLSSFHRSYAYPSVLIEADLRARLKQEEIKMVLDKIISKFDERKLILRRSTRPF